MIILLLDFSENCSFVCQDSVQGFYWNNNQATVHAFTFYEKDINWSLKVVSTTFLLVCFVCLKEKTCETRENVFYFTSKVHFIRDNQILNFHIFKCHDIIKCLSINAKPIFLNNLGGKHSLIMKFGQFMYH